MLLRDQADFRCPFVIASTIATPAQRSALINTGISAIVEQCPSLHELKAVLSHLAFRLESPLQEQELVAVTNGLNNKRRGLSLLIADDNSSNRMLIARILTEAGHIVQEADRGDTAFDLLASQNFDVGLLDLNMPDMSGPDVIKLYRAASVGARRLPIIILSADASPAAKQECLEAGADEFLTKPVGSDALLAAINRVLGQTVSMSHETNVLEGRTTISPVFNQLIDGEQIQSLRRISKDDNTFLAKFMAAAFNDLEAAILELRNALRGNNEEAARSSLHIIEGTAASLGAVALVRDSKGMRPYISVANDPDRATALAELSTTLALTKSALGAMLQDTRLREETRTSQR
jgi:two-component system sensor histidine kinase RpfC